MSARFQRDLVRLSPSQRAALQVAVARFIEDLSRGSFRKGLRVKGVRGAGGVFEMAWGEDGRATFEYGKQIRPGEPHIVWRRCGTHDIFGAP